MVMADITIPDESVAEAGMSMCQAALGGKRCPCAESGVFKCKDEHPGQQAIRALRAGLAAWPGMEIEEDPDGAGDALFLPLTQEKTDG